MKKTQFSKTLVSVILGLNVAFTVAILYVFLMTGSEPTTLVASWFTFTGVELMGMAAIKTTKEKKRKNDNTKNKEEHDA